MMKRYLLLPLFLLLLSAAKADVMQDSIVLQNIDTLKYRITLTDKNLTHYSLDHPEEYLSERAIQRRHKQHLSVDSTDLPLCDEYVNAIRNVGVKVIAQSKWLNFVTVSCNEPAKIRKISLMPFVRKVEKVWVAPKGADAQAVSQRNEIVSRLDNYPDTVYGAGYGQIHVSNGERLHEAGFRGKGIVIAVIDGGYHNLDRIPALSNVKIEGSKNFVDTEADIYAETSHGLGVLSCMAMNRPNRMIGTAPAASYWLLRSEDTHSENPIEQDFWAMAAEYADSVGVDIINTSLGYNDFDDPSMSFRLRDVDGVSTVIAASASHLADKGILLVCSAGNSGATSWKKITPPADAFDILTVGAIKTSGELARFSSVGTTADGRIKPDVLAVGVESSIITAQGSQGHANGTSFASPIMCGMVACLWQACPDLTVRELIDLVRQSGDRSDCPDNVYGYGIPDMWKAYQTYLASKSKDNGR